MVNPSLRSVSSRARNLASITIAYRVRRFDSSNCVTHCRGAIFLDGNRYLSEALEARLDEVLSSYEGFYFGRFDV